MIRATAAKVHRLLKIATRHQVKVMVGVEYNSNNNIDNIVIIDKKE